MGRETWSSCGGKALKTVTFTDNEIKALIFAVKADLETVNAAIEEFAGEDETLMTVLQKLEQA